MSVVLQIVCDGKRYSLDLTQLIKRTFSENTWQESRHKRDKDGRFSSGSGKGEEGTGTQKVSVVKTSGRGKVKRSGKS